MLSIFVAYMRLAKLYIGSPTYLCWPTDRREREARRENAPGIQFCFNFLIFFLNQKRKRTWRIKSSVILRIYEGSIKVLLRLY